jgi:hypothetical protein
MKKYSIYLAIFISLSLAACSQNESKPACVSSIDSLYNKYHEHLIFCSYYNDSINKLLDADSINLLLPFYYKEDGTPNMKEKESWIITNLKLVVCDNKENLIKKIGQWCAVSLRLANLRHGNEFTLDGYMSFLNTEKVTKHLLENYLTGNRTFESLSTNEMEYIYFASIGYITTLTIKEQDTFWGRLAKWDFMN